MSPQKRTLEQLLSDSEEINRQKALENNALKRALDAERREHDTAELIRKEIFGLAEYTPQAPEWLTGKGIKNGERGGPVLMLSDIHYGERIFPDEIGGVNEFNAPIAAARIKRLMLTTIDLCENHMGRASVKYPGIVLCLGGDLIGGDIHEELMVTNDRTPMQAINELTDILAASINTLADFFGRVFVVSVVGNHGRATRKPRAKTRVFTNYDWVISCNLERHFREDKRVQFMIPSEADAHFSVYGTRFLLTHGDSLGTKGGDGIIGALGPIARGVLKVGASERQIGRDFDYLLGAHWHQLLWLPNAIFNGCVKGYDEYAKLMLRAPYQPPQQALFFVHPEHGLTARWPVFLEPRRVAAQSKVWVGWEK